MHLTTRILWRQQYVFMVLLCTMSVTMYLLNPSYQEISIFIGSFLNIRPKSCACQQCIVGQENDTWFYGKFNMSIQPLLTTSNRDIPSDTFRWWMKLQKEHKPSNLTEVLDKLFHIIPGEENYMDARPSRCRTCAVVGNSGNLRLSCYGDFIDSNDFVIRINKAPTKGYERDVGSRTTHHVMYPESAIDLNDATSLLLVPFKILDLEWLISALTTGNITRTYARVMSRIKANRNKILVISPTFQRYIHDSWLEGHGRYSSTGFIALIFALHVCDEVNVFGFGADQNGNWHHYWEKNTIPSGFRKTGVHDGDQQHFIIQTLAEKGKITVFKGITWS
ncbi:CMP-N-acetylneuraminate-beta-galactosamide-alpha-2,3-sialyltransferase 1-like [Brachyhypopomus gauderio]|uniref:CMP-N-acetylneuraminate-beta-galactosamide- alpha-2,3-sialyltransferase 1-like n=1 Tax=Brachyhypopomus gauderio TaxID=698409 RepID=UPI0040437AD0